MSQVNTNSVGAPSAPQILLSVNDWIQEAQKRAVEYEGMPEAQYFLTEARRYLALSGQIESLEKIITR